MRTPIADFVKQYTEADMSRFHMPGHKGRASSLGCEPFDLTEVAGADALCEAGGIIAESEANATVLFGSGHTFYSAEGSSLCIRAMIFLTVQAWRQKQGDARPVILAARNAHKAFLYACALTDTDVHWLYPEERFANNEAGPASICSCPITPETAEAAILEELERGGSLPAALYVTSPDYLGGRQDLPALAALCRRYGIPLLVDNAHGAYLKFLPKPCHPMDLGAAMCCDSAHKTLPVLTGGAYLHIAKDFLPDSLTAVRQSLSLFGSTSPSYLVLQSLDLCNAALSGSWPARLAETVAALDTLKANLRALGYTVASAEPLKLTILTADAYSGDDLADALRAFRVECEHSDSESCIFMISPENSSRDLERLEAALREVAPQFLSSAASSATDFTTSSSCGASYRPVFLPAPVRMSIRDAVFAPSELLSPEEALGRICATPVVSCPPAIPIAVSGEEITKNTVRLFRHYGIETVRVVL